MAADPEIWVNGQEAGQVEDEDEETDGCVDGEDKPGGSDYHADAGDDGDCIS